MKGEYVVVVVADVGLQSISWSPVDGLVTSEGAIIVSALFQILSSGAMPLARTRVREAFFRLILIRDKNAFRSSGNSGCFHRTPLHYLNRIRLFCSFLNPSCFSIPCLSATLFPFVLSFSCPFIYFFRKARLAQILGKKAKGVLLWGTSS